MYCESSVPLQIHNMMMVVIIDLLAIVPHSGPEHLSGIPAISKAKDWWGILPWGIR